MDNYTDTRRACTAAWYADKAAAAIALLSKGDCESRKLARMLNISHASLLPVISAARKTHNIKRDKRWAGAYYRLQILDEEAERFRKRNDPLA